MAEGKSSFILYSDTIHVIEKLSNEQAGILFKHLLRYVNDQNPEPLDTLLDLVFEPIKQHLKRDLKKWEKGLADKSIGGREGNLRRWHPELYKKYIKGKITLEQAELAYRQKESDTDEENRIPSDGIGSVAVSVSVIDSVNVINWEDFISGFNGITKKNFRGNDKVKGQLSARSKEGYKLEQILTATRNCFSDPYHREHPQYLTPEFILRADKLDKYINYSRPIISPPTIAE